MTSRRATTLLIVGVVLLVAGGIGWWQFAAPALFPPPTAPPPPSPTPMPTFAVPGGTLELPPSLEELATEYPELGAVLLDSQLSSVYKEFVLAYENGGVEAARQLAIDRDLLDDQNRVRLTIELDTTDTAELEQQLEDNGVQVLAVHGNLMDVAIPMRIIEAAAEQENPGALFEQISQLDHVVRIRLPIRTAPSQIVDPVPGEGVKVTGAELWHQAGLRGQGIRVGVLDLGFDGYDRLLGRGLPQQVVAQSFVPGVDPEDAGEVHGTAVAEIVHEMAPDAELYFAYYDGGDVSYRQAVDWLVSQNVHIISHSAGGVVGPMDGSDNDAQMVDRIDAQGILWVNSSGNEADVHYRGQFNTADGNNCHVFPNGSEGMGVIAGRRGVGIFLNWDDWDNPAQDFDLFVYDESGNLIGSSEDYQNGQPGQWPVEIVVSRNVPAQSVVYAKICAAGPVGPAIFDIYAQGLAVQFPVPEHSLVSPADARGSFTVGAVDWASGVLVDYSSQGPSNDGRLKPDISAPTGVSSASYPAPDTFTGTSASAPHVSGAAALVWSANPNFTASDVKQYLMQHATDLPPAGHDSRSGAGALRLPPPAGVPEATVTAAVATEAAFVSTAAPIQQPRPVDSGSSAAVGGAAAVAIALACGGFFVCGFGLVLVGGIALVAASGRKRRPVPSPPVPPVPMGGAPAPAWPPPTDPVPPPSQPAPAAVPRDATAPAIPVGPGRASLRSPSGRAYALRPEGVTFGRAPECDVVLDSSQVSRTHATVRLEANAWAIRDLGSSNGTFLNGERLQPNVTYRLSPQDEIVLGGHGGETLTFVLE